MSETKIKKAGLIICLLSAFAVLAAIYFFSSQSGPSSSKLSGAVVGIIARLFEIGASPQNLRILTVSVRKLAHFSLFSALGLSLCGAAHFSFNRFSCAVAAVTGLMFALLDETHQSFVLGRNSCLQDVFIDFCGVVFACSVFEFVRLAVESAIASKSSRFPIL